MWLLNIVVHLYNFYTTLKSIHYNVLPYFNIGPGIFHTLLKPERHGVVTSLRRYELQRKKYLELVVPVIAVCFSRYTSCLTQIHKSKTLGRR